MTMLKRVEKLTQAEEAMLAAAAEAPANSGRAAAAGVLRERGLPTRRVEAWHYTDLRSAIKGFPGLAESGSQAVESVSEVPGFIPAARISFVDGAIASQDALPAGITAQQAVPVGGFRDAADAVGLLNTLLATGGVKIEVSGDVRDPVELLHVIRAEKAVALRHSVQFATDAAGVIVERHTGAAASQSNTVIDLVLEDRSQATWLFVQEEGADAAHLSQLNVRLGEEAKLTILCLNAGGRFVRREIDIVSTGENAELAIKGVNLVGGSSHVDVTTVLLHEAPCVTATEVFRNVATGSGSGVFQGQIRVAQAAQKTDARMACNTLLLSDEAEFFAKPELEIFADDVQCAHGATVTDILDDHLFYLRARGIPEKLARAMLVQAFVEEVFDEVENETIREALDSRIESWLEKHG